MFVPGSRPDRFEKAAAAGADLICIDLEDAVLPSDKDSARQAVVEFVKNNDLPVCVRVNPVDTMTGKADLSALADVKPAFVMLAKCASAEQVTVADQILGKQSQIIGLIETPQGLDNATDIGLASERLIALMFGGADMSAELGCDFAYEPLLFVRSQLVFAAAKAGVDLIDVPFVDIKNEAGLAEETKKIKALGFTAKAAIHPCQLAGIHQAFTPTQDQIARAQAVVDAVDGPDAGVVVVNGRMVDRPIILAAQRTLALAEKAQSV